MFHLRLKAARQAVDLTQQEAAESLQITQGFLSKLESGNTRVPNAELLVRIAKLYGTTKNYLLGDPNEAEPRFSVYSVMQRSVMTDDSAPEGLRELAADKAVVDALEVTDEEWRMLLTINLPKTINKNGYVQLLATIRGVCK
ncbi:hypothetical protein CKO12_13560 [Chromatium okenii]|uniref:helix-turn-helix domain-containing protein n=1 Tax=Chromatium okenii TaxID=61644 RepID=UPI001908CDD6|nr:helix-turn-helix transcriptional regulator [Chromatium okenii]MBK1642877.1 hypothetical protein [Chromatium okenii]